MRKLQICDKPLALNEHSAPSPELWNLVLREINILGQIPSVSNLLIPLMKCVSQPSEKIDVSNLVRLISLDAGLTAQCLHVANSPLFGSQREIDSVHAAVTLLGTQRLREMATACCLLSAFSGLPNTPIRSNLWKHALSCAMVSRRVSLLAGYARPDEAYLSGLLHDLGQLIELSAFPQDFPVLTGLASDQGESIHLVEQQELGFDHCAVGFALAEHWQFSRSLKAVIRFHHDPGKADFAADLVLLVSLCDAICRSHTSGYGYEENSSAPHGEVLWGQLRQLLPAAAKTPYDQLLVEAENELSQTESLVSVLSVL